MLSKMILKIILKVPTSWQIMTHSHILKRETAKYLVSNFQAPT